MKPPLPRRISSAVLLASFSTLLFAAAAFAAQQPGIRLNGLPGVQRTTQEIMAAPQITDPAILSARQSWEMEQPDRSGLPQDPLAPEVASYPDLSAAVTPPATILAPQTPDLFFTGATLAETGAFPPDNMGAVGPSQYVVFVNGRLRTFNKNTGTADGVLNADPDVFFSSVMTPLGGGVVLNFTSDPMVRYDRLSGRWILMIIDVPCTNNFCTTLAANRCMIAVSDAASAGVISGGTVWTFYWFTQGTNFIDYPSLGVDAQALYIGGDMFTPAGSFTGCDGFVVRKTSILSGGPIVTTAFPNMVAGSGDGPFAPRGVDNYDPAANEGYFIGVSNAAFSRLVIRRVSNPGGSPTISGNILLTVGTTAFPITMDHLGNTGGTNGRLDALDDRLYAAHIRNGRLWTAHNIAVTSTGVGSGSNSARRDGIRWYELNGIRSTDNGGVPVVVQSGTLFDPAATLAASRQYTIPSMMVSGQGHVAMGYSTAGTPNLIDAGTVGRLAGAALGTMQATAMLSSSATSYNPPSDPGGAGGRRWGDYSYTSLDPLDDMTMWTIQEFCDATNSYGCRVARLRAPLPATPTIANDVIAGQASTSTTVTGTVVSGSGFYDPGTNLPGVPAFNHISAVITNTGVTGTPPTVNSVTYLDPTTISLNLNTVGATPNLPGEMYGVRVTNPDGQVKEGSMVLRVLSPPVATLLTMFVATPTEEGIELRWQLSGSGASSNVEVQRATRVSGPWSAVAVAVREENGVSIGVDREVDPGVSYQYRLVIRENDGGNTTFGPISGSMGERISRFTIESVAPNPTSGNVQIRFAVGREAHVRMSVVDIQGREIAVLVDGERPAGRHMVSWDGRRGEGPAAPGVYFIRFRGPGVDQNHRLTIAR